MSNQINEIFYIISTKGHQQYGGEAVTQLEHALQCAMLAENAGETPELITACLFHDLGHLIHHLGENIAEQGIDDRHEYRALGMLSKLFHLTVTEPIRLHVEAKRYLCKIDSNYLNTLSSASQLSLKLQGGVFNEEQVSQFEQNLYALEATKLRRWDEQAKIPNLVTPPLSHFKKIALSSLA
ncbi:MAG: phosphonate degradation HD-domain oxygenase [Microcystaceae cyanobacterium]